MDASCRGRSIGRVFHRKCRHFGRFQHSKGDVTSTLKLAETDQIPGDTTTMNRHARAWALTTLFFLGTHVATAQVPPPPGPAGPLPPPPPAAPPVAAEPDPTPPADQPPPPPAASAPGQQAQPAQQAQPTQQAAPPPEGDDFAEGDGQGDPDAISEEEFEELQKRQEERKLQLKTQSGFRASTGMMRTYYAGSGPVGTFRFAILGSYMGTDEFLCPQCEDPSGGPGSTPDDVSRVGAHVLLSATPFEFLEGYFGVHSTATSNTRGDPELLQVLGDTTWGVKAFMPRQPDSIFTAGGAAELWMLNGTGGVGIDNASVALRGLTTFDLTNRSDPAQRVPLRVNFSLSYIFDNSGALVEDIEAQRNRVITRIERYGLNISRLDRLVPALGIEGMFEVVRPYLEWSIDVPSNRQDYTCLQNDVHAGDACLQDAGSFTGTPSRFTLGTRVFGLLDGLGFHAALDLGTGGMKPPFWEEVQPESPWNLYFGVAYTADTVPQVERVKVKADVPPAPEPEPPPTVYVVEGVVVEKDNEGVFVPNAILRYQGQPLTGMVANEQGSFRSANLDPGTYTLQVTAEGYNDGECSVTIDPNAGAAAAGPDMAPSAEGADAPPPVADIAAPGAQPDGSDGVRVTKVRCELEPKPALGTLEVSVVDASNQEPIAGATVVPSKDGRSITLTADGEGEIVVADVPAGPVSVRVSAEGYYPTTQPVDVVAETRTRAPFRLQPVGRSNYVVGADAIKMRQPIEFEPNSAKLTDSSMGLLDELAALLVDKPDLAIEVVSHTDDSSSFQVALTLTTERASTIRERLVANGVDPGRVAAKGAGSEKPLVPNANDKNRARNNRIELLVRSGQ